MDPRLRAAVDASVAWYDDVFALHDIPVRRADGLWCALATPPPWHSAVKTLGPGQGSDRVARATERFEHCAVADSFGDLALAPYGFEVVIDASWFHRDAPPTPPGPLPDGWSVVRDAETLTEWSEAHDYVGVLSPAVLDDGAFQVLACHRGGRLAGGAVTHDRGATVGFSNAWGAGLVAESDEVLTVVSALHHGRPLSGFAEGAELAAMVAAGFSTSGTQRVWLR